MRVAEMLASADVIIELAVVLTQEIHDGPFEVHTGHGIWATWDGYRTYSLEGKTLVRIDLDPNLRKPGRFERQGASGAGRHRPGLAQNETNRHPLPHGNVGFCPAGRQPARYRRYRRAVAGAGLPGGGSLGIQLDFVSHPQQTPEGKAMREWIVETSPANPPGS